MKARLSSAIYLFIGIALSLKEINCACPGFNPIPTPTFSEFESLFNRTYASKEERQMRIAQYEIAVDYVNKINSDPANTFTAVINKFSDLTQDEKNSYLGLVQTTRSNSSTTTSATTAVPTTKCDLKCLIDRFLNSLNRTTTASPQSSNSSPGGNRRRRDTIGLNWANPSYNRVTSVKNQGDQCSSSWAFAVAGAAEAAFAESTGILTDFSAQFLVDCSEYIYSGCHGGNILEALNLLVFGNGMPTEADYPFTGGQNECVETNAKFYGFINYMEPLQYEGDLENALRDGPVAVSIRAAESFFSYGGGVINSNDCDCDAVGCLNYAVLLTGYGTTDDGQGYWIVKNSWGENWGENGYARLVRGREQCGIGVHSAYVQGVNGY